MSRRPPAGGAAESGNAALELVILAPVIVLLICLVIAAGRIAIAQGSIDAAARDAARQASIARSPEAARLAALSSASAALAGDGLSCSPVPAITTPELNVDFGVPLGTPVNVTVVVRCRLSLSGLVLPGLPGSLALSYQFSSPLDPYRGRTG
jgi:Flp pilus assembly protein TadG